VKATDLLGHRSVVFTAVFRELVQRSKGDGSDVAVKVNDRKGVWYHYVVRQGSFQRWAYGHCLSDFW